ncbi:DUF1924 domain-containing protein [Vogesella sp. DC21W]|uniref:DUF1924 domain-containing protein n=1 Tax=Vogesella aquatica TaxID=2984206 RepID=A0ABT5J261_9NEIS|nr:DUF1924 domain-containing protein [Vogesella aquatica]MDC7717934.1 DUF1924 domain-containing protein [Vogesella aquatica]
MRISLVSFSVLLGVLSLPAEANPALLSHYQQQALQENPGFSGFSAARGKLLYSRQSSASGKTMSCTSCHTADPRQPGKTPAFRELAPLAPSVTPTRFTDLKKVEKWFRRNCDDVYQRSCTAQEKGDFVSWILSVK